MNDVPTAEGPAWVRKRDGRLVPFEADRISRALFAATESLGQPDAFLARELTDGIIHFLMDDADDRIPTTEQIAEMVVKSVEQLGHPHLARAFADHRQTRQSMASTAPAEPAAPIRPPRSARAVSEIELLLRFPSETPLDEVLETCKRHYTLQTVFARDLVAIHNDGLLTLGGLDAPDALAACVLDPRAYLADGVVADLHGFRGRVVVLDGPEHHQARAEQPPDAAVRVVRQLECALERSGLRAVANLNAVTPPTSEDDLAGGPLFAGQRPVVSQQGIAERVDRWLDLLAESPGGIRVDWHLGERDFRPEQHSRLERVVRRALAGGRMAFVFDRPRRPVALAEGINRRQPAVLQEVGLHLPRLAEQTSSTDNPERFLQKLSSLARLALSAGVQKRAYLRKRHGEAEATDLTAGFLLDRARLLVTPVGLDALVRTLTGRGLSTGGTALDLGKQIVQRLREVLRQDGRASRLEACLDGPAGETEAGLTPWETGAALKAQCRSAGALHALAEHGTLTLFLSAGAATAAEVMPWLQHLAEQTEVVRVVLRSGHSPMQ